MALNHSGARTPGMAIGTQDDSTTQDHTHVHVWTQDHSVPDLNDATVYRVPMGRGSEPGEGGGVAGCCTGRRGHAGTAHTAGRWQAAEAGTRGSLPGLAYKGLDMAYRESRLRSCSKSPSPSVCCTWRRQDQQAGAAGRGERHATAQPPSGGVPLAPTLTGTTCKRGWPFHGIVCHHQMIVPSDVSHICAMPPSVCMAPYVPWHHQMMSPSVLTHP